MKAYMFPGQGSQYKGMGMELFAEFSDILAKADQILGYSVEELCLKDPEKVLNKTQYTQPALYTVSALHYLKQIKQDKTPPQYLIGHSLGEYNALFAAGVFDFETGLRLVQKRGDLMSRAPMGAMAAVLNGDKEKIDSILKENHLDRIDVANYNAPGQIVIAGPKKEIIQAAEFFDVDDLKYIPLNVSSAFHSRYMKDVTLEFATFLQQFSFKPPKIKIVSNVQARPYKEEEIRENLIKQIESPVQWIDSIRYLMGKNVTDYYELGPGNVLGKLVIKIRENTTPLVFEEVQATKKTVHKNRRAGKTLKKEKELSLISSESLGSTEFKKDYNLKYAYLLGGMVKGISSKQMVVKAAKAGMLCFYGSGGMKKEKIEEAIQYIQERLTSDEPYGINFLHNSNSPASEMALVDMLLRYKVRVIEASAFIQITPALVKYRLKGLKKSGKDVIKSNKIIAKLSRPEVAKAFMCPAPEGILNKLMEEGEITGDELEMGKTVPMADDVTVESDSGGHTDMGVASAIIPSIITLRDQLQNEYNYSQSIRIGSAGGIGTPSAAAAAFILGADYILTGSINQCSVEAGTSNLVKTMLQEIDVQDTAYAPAGDMFELGAKVQVLKKGVFFPARANKLHELWKQHKSLDGLESNIKSQIQDRYFKRSFEEVYQETKTYYEQAEPSEIVRAEKSPKYKMALIFRWYFIYSMRLAKAGKKEDKVDFQIHCGPALGAFNQWVKGSELENWEQRNVDIMGVKLMEETAQFLTKQILHLSRPSQ